MDRWESYAYIVTEAPGQGLQIVDLSPLPVSVKLLRSDHDVDVSHTVFISNVDFARPFHFSRAKLDDFTILII